MQTLLWHLIFVPLNGNETDETYSCLSLGSKVSRTTGLSFTKSQSTTNSLNVKLGK